MSRKRPQSAPAKKPAPARGGTPTPAAQPRRRWLLPVVAGGLVAIVAAAVLLLAPGQTAARGTPTALSCKGFPPFATELGFSLNAAIDSGDTRQPGLRVIEPQDGGEPKVYEDPSWQQAGHLGAPVLDQSGNIYVAPAPQISVALNPPEQQNRIYKIDGATGTMALLVDLPPAQPPTLENPYGILGLAVDCRTNSLYAASVAGSTRAAEAGRLVRIDLVTGQVAAQIDGIDGFGLAVATDGDAPGGRLYLGRARTAEVWSVALDTRGNFSGQPQRELAFGRWLNDGEGRARRLALGTDGSMTLTASPFAYTLAPPSTAPQPLRFVYNPSVGAWEYVGG
ncbi:MAG TPA: hypothetical protein VFS21_26365 [Roseiflexaceae bacterium]|nr:hypothetical protein [Roseiflexaceae bacterium]